MDPAGPNPKHLWYIGARCRELGAEKLFFVPDEDEPFNPGPAKLICNGTSDLRTLPCPVRSTCLDWAIANGDKGVIRGGMDDNERARERRRRNRDKRSSITGPATSPSAGNAANRPSPPPPPADQETEFPIQTRADDHAKPRLQALLDYLAEELASGASAITTEPPEALQPLAESLGHDDWPKTLKFIAKLRRTSRLEYQLVVGFLSEQLADHEIALKLQGETALEDLAVAIGYPNWMAARTNFVDMLISRGVIVYLRFTYELIVHFGIARMRLDQQERESRMPGYLWRAEVRRNQEPAVVPGPYQYLVKESPDYKRTHPFKDGSVSDDHMTAILSSIIASGGELGDVSPDSLSKILCGLSKGSIARVLQNLDAAGYIQRDKDSAGRVKPGSPLRITGHGVVWMLDHEPTLMKDFARKSA